jgi:hypothetical protein
MINKKGLTNIEASSGTCSGCSCCWVARPPPRTSSSSCCAMRSPCCAAPTPNRVWSGRIGPCSRAPPPAAPSTALPSPGHSRTPSCAGTAASSADDGPTRTGGPVAHPSTPPSPRWSYEWRRRTRAGDMQGAKRAAQTRPPRRRLHDPPDSQAPPHPAGTGAAHRHQLATVPAHPSRQHAGRRLLPRRLRTHPAATLRPVRDRGQQPLPARPGRHRAPRRP